MRDTTIPTSTASPTTMQITAEKCTDSNNVDMTEAKKGRTLPTCNKSSDNGDVAMGDVTDALKKMKTEAVDEQGQWCPEKKQLMSLELLLNGADAESDQDKESISAAMSPASDEGNRSPRSSQSESERSTTSQVECGTPPPTSSFPVQSRPPCAICRNENGRCHASDPMSMQTFFSNTLGFDGSLNTTDWLCMKCYSKWYNRCKRKASALNNAMNDGPSPRDSSAPPTPQRRKRAKESKEKEKRKHRKAATPKEVVVAQPIEIHAEPEPELLDHDTDSDDALLLTRMTLKSYNHHYNNNPHSHLSNSFNGTSQIDNRHHITAGRDLEMEVDELHSELHRMRSEMMRLAQELNRRDEQMEGMLKFVKTEMASMHGLMQDIADSRSRKQHHSRPGTPPQLQSMSHHPHSVQTPPLPLPQTNHIFHLNGKILDNKPIPTSPIPSPTHNYHPQDHTHPTHKSDITV